ncbi:MAG: small multi-drug export protein [Candidatus Altiarchaeota archaeon]
MDLLQLFQNQWLYVIVITILPWIELRGGIPAGILLGLNPLMVFVVAVLANCAIIYPSFIFLDWFFDLMNRIPFVSRMIRKTHEKAKPYVDKYGVIGLMLFVGMPLPGTGAYAGALVAHLMGMKNKKAFVAISLGVLIAGVAVLLVATVFRETLGWILELKLI